MATEKELVTANIFFHAAFPVIKVVLKHDPVMTKKFRNVTARIQFRAKDEAGDVGAYLDFNKGEFQAVVGFCPDPDVELRFPTAAKMNAMLQGKNVLPGLKFKNPSSVFLFLGKVFPLLNCLKLMLPDNKPADPLKKYLKLKMSLYMVSTAFSYYNKNGRDAEVQSWTGGQPDRVYQFSVEPDETDIAVYIRVKAGMTKAGRGFYERKKPFVHFRFQGVDNALKVLGNEVGFVEAVDKNYIQVYGSPEYAGDLNNFLAKIQGLVT